MHERSLPVRADLSAVLRVLDPLARRGAVKSPEKQARPDGPKRRPQGNRVPGTLIRQKVRADNIRMKTSENEENMATMALPICELGPVIVEAERAQADTKCVVSASGAQAANLTTVWHVFQKTISLRYRFSSLVGRQGALIDKLVDRDFSGWTPDALTSLAAKIDDLIVDERDVLKNANSLGVPIRVWWGSSLSAMAEQVEYLDSISQSLHVACDDEASTLIAIAVGELAMQ